MPHFAPRQAGFCAHFAPKFYLSEGSHRMKTRHRLEIVCSRCARRRTCCSSRQCPNKSSWTHGRRHFLRQPLILFVAGVFHPVDNLAVEPFLKVLSRFLEPEVNACVLDRRVDLGTRLRVCERCLLCYSLFPAPVDGWLSAVIAVSESM
jgi:hypothetical protein